MPAPERIPRVEVRAPEEREPAPYYQAARFAAEGSALIAKAQAHAVIGRATACDLSTYHFLLNQVSHVAVIGAPPLPDLDHRLRAILAAGDTTALPAHVVRLLMECRRQARACAVQGTAHDRPGIQVYPTAE